jgi:endoglucanase
MEMKKTDLAESNTSAPGSISLTRRTLLKSAAAVASASLFPFEFVEAAFGSQNTSATKLASSAPKAPAKNPRWYGFNLLEYFSTDPDWMKYFPYKDDGMFPEDDFRWIRDWGFNWVRLPMDYRFWTDPQDHFKIYEEKVVPIDRAIRLGEKYGVHVNVCLHRAPGYCILDTMNESLTGIHITKETTDLFTDPKTQDAFVYQWTYFADRYKGISSEKLSFNLVNEPIIQPTTAELQELAKAGVTRPEDIFKSAVMQAHAKDYVRVAKAATDGIRKHDPQRLVITDGLVAGNVPIPELFDTGIMQSCHTYNPMPLTHYQCEWARGFLTGSEPIPTWPLKDSNGKVICDRNTLTNTFQPWEDLAPVGIPIHFGEMGCYKHTPPQVVHAWFSDTLGVLSGLNTGWALWNFRGPFGVLDTERPGTKYEKWHNHQLDRALLDVLQQNMKKS